MNHACDEKLWDCVLSFNFSVFSNRVKRNLEDNLEIFLYLKFRFYSFVFSNLSLYSVFSHFCFCKRTCDQKRSSECQCQFCSRIYLQIFDNHNIFQDIVVDEPDFTREFDNFFQKTSLFSLDVCQYFNNLFDSMKSPENYTATCYKIINDPPEFIDLT